MTQNDLGIADRLRRNGRPPRTHVVATRFTAAEAATIKAAAAFRGLTAREWARETMLQAARAVPTDLPLFTELVALRLLANMVLRPIALGEKLSPEAYAQILAQVRNDKHEAAREMLSQYQAKGE